MAGDSPLDEEQDMERVELLGKSLAELKGLVVAWGQKPYRGKQLYHHLYRRQVLDWEGMTDIAAAFRAFLAEQAMVTLPRARDVARSIDGTAKYLFEMADGQRVESVYIPDEGRTTLCLSTQVGCPMGCRFCATARLGFVRQLTAGEIVGQYLAISVDRQLLDRPVNIVFMGMGEPLLNFEAVMGAFDILHDPEGVALSRRKITLSTCGLPDGIRRLGARECRPKLAVSLNAADDEVRGQIMPVNRNTPLAELLQACQEFPLGAGERLTFEYVMIAGLNDGRTDARKLVRLLHGIRCKVNLIPCNSIEAGGFLPPDEARVLEFQQTLQSAGYTVIIRKSRGQDIAGACGQLAGERVKG